MFAFRLRKDFEETETFGDDSPEAANGFDLKLTEGHAISEVFLKQRWGRTLFFLRLAPSPLRSHLFTMLAFAQRLCDMVHTLNDSEACLNRLGELDQTIDRIGEYKKNDTLLAALDHTLTSYFIPRQLLHDMITGSKVDVLIQHFETREQLHNFLALTAAPVGRTCLHVLGYPAPTFLELSDRLCIAARLTWILTHSLIQDRHIYLPREEMDRFGYTLADLKAHTMNEAFRRLIVLQMSYIEDQLQTAAPLCGRLPGRLGMMYRYFWLSIHASLQGIAHNNFNLFNPKNPPRGQRWAKLLTTLRRDRFLQKSAKVA